MRKLIVVAIILLLLTNVVVLSGVVYNRFGEPLASLVLTERELGVVGHYASREENSGTALFLEWHTVNNIEKYKNKYFSRYSPVWLNDSKLISLGFDLISIRKNKKKYDYDWHTLSQDVVFVLEYDGDAFQQAVSQKENEVNKISAELDKSPDDEKLAKKLEDRKKTLQHMKLSESRLYIIDASLEEQVLLDKYRGKNKYIFIRGEVGLEWHDDIVGVVRNLFVKNIHVPLPDSRQLHTITQGKRFYSYDVERIAPRYQVKLNIGKRLEPWIASVNNITIVSE